MKRPLMYILTFLLFAVLVTAATIPMRYTLDFYGQNGIRNATIVQFSDGTNMTTAAISGFSANATSNLNMSNYNITNVKCIYFPTGNICG